MLSMIMQHKIMGFMMERLLRQVAQVLLRQLGRLQVSALRP